MASAKVPTALGCYIFAGGFTVGVARHFNVLAHFEEGPYGTETAAHNLPFLRGKIFTDPATWPVEDYVRRVDFVYGNPPCAPWSVCSAGRKVPWRLDPRVGCAQRLYSLLDRIEPKVWAFESVRPAFTKGREMIDDMALKAMDRGYDATALMVEGTRHGVPQRRPRFFLVLSKYRLPWEPTEVTRLPTVGDAFAKPFKSFTCTKEGSKFFLALVRRTKQGQRVAAKFNELYPERVAEAERTGEWCKGRPSFQNIRLDPSEPSCTITGGAKQIHPTEHRLISIEESQALCGYPRDFKFLGSIGMQYRQVAQAVMPPVGEYLARMVRDGLRTKAVVRKPAFERVEIFTDRVERAPLEAQAALPFDEPTKKMISLPPSSPEGIPMKESKLSQQALPCPKCGSKALSYKTADKKDCYFACEKRGCACGGTGKTPKEALARWNDVAWRASIAPPAKGRKTKSTTPLPSDPNSTHADLVTPRTLKKSKAKALEAPKQRELPMPDQNRRGREKEPARSGAKVPAGAVQQTRGGCGARIRELLKKGIADAKILETIHKEFPWSKATQSDVNWNRRKLRNDEGVEV